MHVCILTSFVSFLATRSAPPLSDAYYTISYRTRFNRTKDQISDMKIFLSLITVFLYTVATQATVTTDSFDFEAEGS